MSSAAAFLSSASPLSARPCFSEGILAGEGSWRPKLNSRQKTKLKTQQQQGERERRRKTGEEKKEEKNEASRLADLTELGLAVTQGGFPGGLHEPRRRKESRGVGTTDPPGGAMRRPGARHLKQGSDKHPLKKTQGVTFHGPGVTSQGPKRSP